MPFLWKCFCWLYVSMPPFLVYSFTGSWLFLHDLGAFFNLLCRCLIALFGRNVTGFGISSSVLRWDFCDEISRISPLVYRYGVHFFFVWRFLNFIFIFWEYGALEIKCLGLYYLVLLSLQIYLKHLHVLLVINFFCLRNFKMRCYSSKLRLVVEFSN